MGKHSSLASYHQLQPRHNSEADLLFPKLCAPAIIPLRQEVDHEEAW